jgi:hypothetical protein
MTRISSKFRPIPLSLDEPPAVTVIKMFLNDRTEEPAVLLWMIYSVEVFNNKDETKEKYILARDGSRPILRK